MKNLRFSTPLSFFARARRCRMFDQPCLHVNLGAGSCTNQGCAVAHLGLNCCLSRPPESHSLHCCRKGAEFTRSQGSDCVLPVALCDATFEKRVSFRYYLLLNYCEQVGCRGKPFEALQIIFLIGVASRMTACIVHP